VPAELIERIAVIGAGLMGHGIAQAFASAGYQVSLTDVSEEKLQQALKSIEGNLRMLVTFGVLSPERVAAVLGNVVPNLTLREAASNVDLVIESVFENLELKQSLFRELDAVCPEHTILGSNSSAIMPSRLAQVTRRPEKVVGIHFFNPPYLVPLVEVVTTEKTPEAIVDTAIAVLRKLGKQPAVVRKESPGFLANRLQAALFREALSLVSRGVATPEDVDHAIKHGLSRRWRVAGVFGLFDLAGLDTVLSVASFISDLESSHDIPLLLREKVERGELGVKSGRGFYEWTPEQAAAVKRRIAEVLIHG
jgi:3-hydroxybutyryl-CoA dehydrogenase